MTTNHRGRYGRYLNSILILTDFIVINIVFIATCLISPDIIQEHARVTLFLLNISYIPIAIWGLNVHTKRSLHLDLILLQSFKVVGIHALSYLSLLYFLKIAHIPTKSFLILYGLMFVALPLWWSISRQILKYFRSKGRNYIKAIIIGSNETAQRLYDEMLSDAGYGYRVGGFFDDSCPENLKDKYLGTIDDLEEYLKREKVDEIYYTLSGENNKAIRSVIKIADNNVIQFYYVPQLSKYLSRGFELYNMGSVPVLTLRRNPLSKHINRFIKRAFDIIFSSVVLLFSPLYLSRLPLPLRFHHRDRYFSSNYAPDIVVAISTAGNSAQCV